jgi:hypothetical protein
MSQKVESDVKPSLRQLAERFPRPPRRSYNNFNGLRSTVVDQTHPTSSTVPNKPTYSPSVLRGLQRFGGYRVAVIGAIGKIQRNNKRLTADRQWKVDVDQKVHI